MSAASMARATSIAVTSTADDTAGNGNCTLREAVLAANGDTAVDACPAGNGADVITVPAGTYVLTLVGAGEDAAATGDLDITEDVEIEGAGAASTIVDGNLTDRIFDVDPGDAGITAELSGVTVRRGALVAVGGGIRNSGTFTLTESTVTANRVASTVSSRGGGIANFGTLTVVRSTIADNTAEAVGPMTATGVSSFGGGIGSVGTASLVASTVDGNQMFVTGVAFFGGALSGAGISSIGPLSVSDSTVSNNTLDIGLSTSGFSDGGGISSTGGLIVSNSTITGNMALEMSPTGFAVGGGIQAGTAAYSNATIVGNFAQSFGGNIVLLDVATFRNSIVSGCDAIADDISDVVVADAYNVDSTNTCGFSGTDQVSTNPLLGPLQDNGGPTFTRAPLPGSPVLDAGSPAAPGSGGTACESNDQRGVVRPQGIRCDSGSVEIGACPLSPRSGCTLAGKSLLLIKDRDADGATAKDKLLWKWLKGPATMQSDFGDPTAATNLALCVYADAQLRLVAAVPGGDICGGDPCWQTLGSSGYRRSDTAATADGIAKMLLKGGSSAKIIAKGRGAALDLDPDTLPLSAAANVVVQLSNSSNGTCWQSTFAGGAVQKDTDSLFKAKGP